MPKFEHNSEKFGYINLESLAGAQKALTLLGHDAGAPDGKDGPTTQHAVREFQASLIDQDRRHRRPANAPITDG